MSYYPPSPSPAQPLYGVGWTPVLVGHPAAMPATIFPKNDSDDSRAASRYWAQDYSLSARLRILIPRCCKSWMLPIVSSQRLLMRSMDTTTRVSTEANRESNECLDRWLLVPEVPETPTS